MAKSRSGGSIRGACALLGALAGGLLACGAAQAATVTHNRNVSNQMSLARAYWHVMAPTLTAPCPVQVFEGPLTAALGNAGAIEPALNVWAETVDGSCQIVISADMWGAVNRGDTYDTYNTCIAFAHEYGHTLGLADAASPAMMNANWTKASRVDPLCAQYTFGWSKISQASRTWLTANGLAHHHEAPALP
jgi:hypothetical protein